MSAQRARTLTRPAGTDETRRGEEWRDHAACAGEDPQLFFAQDADGAGHSETIPDRDARQRSALRVCGDCTVTAECLAYAVAHRDVDGVWGGTTEAQRRPLIRAGRAEPLRMPGLACGTRQGTEAGYKAHIRAREKACRECLAATALARAERKTRSTGGDS